MGYLNLTKLDPSYATVKGKDFAIEDRQTGKVYVTNKQHINKLFDKMGWRNLNVVSILEEFAGKVISDVGTLRDANIYVDDTNDSFVVASAEAVNWVTNLLSKMESLSYETVSITRYDSCYYWDQLLVKSPKGEYFALYIDLCDEYAQCFSLDYNRTGNFELNALANCGVYHFAEGATSEAELFLMMESSDNSLLADETTPDQKLSMREYLDLLVTLGYARKRRNDKYELTEKGEEAQGYLGDLSSAIDYGNSLNWLQRYVTTAPDGFDFKEACALISSNLGDGVTFWDLRDFYQNNAKEKSDMFLLNA